MTNNEYDLLDLLEKYTKKSGDFIDDLRKLRDDINSHQERCKVAKTVGTTVSATGAAFLVGGLLAAPFTGGGSLILAGYGGVVGSIGGATNLTTEIVDIMWSKKVFQKKAESICEIRNELICQLKNHLAVIQKIAHALVETGIEEETAIILTVYNVANKGRSIFSQARDIASITQTIRTGYLTQGGNIGYFLAARGVKSLDSFGSLAFTLSKWGICVSKAAVQTVLSSVTIVLAVWDVVSLIKGWDEKHPSSVQVTKIIEQIEKELVNIKELRNLFRRMKS
jgi:hypothetical protein